MKPDTIHIAVRRIAAYGVDSILILAWLGLLFLAVTTWSAGDYQVPASLFEKMRGHAIAFLTTTLPVWLYFTLLEASARGATLGKQLLGLHVTTKIGDHLNFSRSALRSMVKFLPWEMSHMAIWYVPGRPFLDDMPLLNLTMSVAALVLVGTYIVMMFTGRGRTVYDLVTGTTISRRPRA